ncbi:MAG: PHP domain-containing protein [bacterium]|nr:PHP domain-containing protein [bacterium]
MNHTKYAPYIYDGHGHSNHSDGLHSPSQIIDHAIKKGLNIIGLSDHNVISGLTEFLKHSDHINRHENVILPIPSIEISTSLGDLLVAIPDRHMAENFISQYKKPKRRFDPMEIIEEYITNYNAIIIFLHPESPYVNCFSLNSIQKLLDKIPISFHKNIGIEIYNWMMQVFFWQRKRKEVIIHQHNHNFNLAAFSFTDYHSATHVGKGSTTMYMTDLSSNSFIDAIQNRRTTPYSINKRDLTQSFETLSISIVAEGLSRFMGRDFHVPKNQ